MTQRKRKMAAPKTKANVENHNGFYRAFEERFRGSRAVIKKRLEVYLPFVKPLLGLNQAAKVLDLGCGRGEWLELMRETGFEVEGIDLDAGMLEACIKIDLPVIQGDAINHLKEKADDSYSVISAFHVVEHITYEELYDLIAEALRVLTPGGLLILETPNPENLIVATSSFYLDPTHKRPIPPDLLVFLPESKGFKRSKILRLQEAKDLLHNPTPDLLAVLKGVSPDYSVVAQKTAPQKMLAVFDEMFKRDYGLSLDTLAGRFDERLQQAEEKAGQAEEKAGQAEEKAGQAENMARQAMETTQRAVTQAQIAEQALQDIFNSHSWRVTKPLRLTGQAARWFKRGTIAWLTFAPQSRPRRVVRQAIISLKLYVASRPHLKAYALTWLAPFPGLKYRLKRVGAMPTTQPEYACCSQAPEQLSPRARQIYHDLKAAIEQRQKEQN